MSARPHLALLALPVLLLAAACGSDSDGSGSGSAVAVKAGDSTCEVATTSFDPGTISFAVENTGKDTTEVYVYGKGSDGDFDKVIGEVENIAPGVSRDFEVKVTGGDYEVACKPGQKGDGIRTAITVSGATASTGTGTEAAYDREVEVKARDFSFVGLTGFTAKVGEKVEFKMANIGPDAQHELEFLGPDGKDIGEVGPTNPGADGEVIITFATAGTYQFLCGIGDHADKGMKGTITVS